jgi:D-xylonolactonase
LFCNDLTVDAEGRVYTGTMYWGPGGMEKHAKLYLVDVDGDVRVLDDGYELANGLAVTADGRTFYAADSTVRRIYAYDRDVATGAIARRRVFVTVPRDEGLPDGLVLDAEGFVWSAQWYGGQIVRYDPDGRVERRIALPATQISCLGFGGADLTEIYVTSAAKLWPSALFPAGFDPARPPGGALYRIRQNLRGRREHAAAVRV